MNERTLVAGPGATHPDEWPAQAIRRRQLALSIYRWYACPRCGETCIAEPTKRAGSVRLVNATGYLHLQECNAYTPKDPPVRYRQAQRQAVAP